jgi:hypothetical protein
MKRLISTCLAVSAIALIAPRPASAASIDINDTGPDPNIVFSVSDFEGGFVLDGVTIQSGAGNSAAVTVSEVSATAPVPIIHTFSADWVTGGLVPSSNVIAFAENGISPLQGVSDILTFTYSVGDLGGHLEGTFESDLDPGLLTLPTGTVGVASEATPFIFNNGNITADARSDVEPAPEPGSLLLLGSALLGFGFLRFRRKTG